ncbi:MAG: GNAT family N-acetyltransferase [Deltaproteobacteria bacterium]|nr:GNAT family N-acetyltransferase [Deltaproteobacteria bacterium]
MTQSRIGAELVLATPAQQADRWAHHYAQWGTGYERSLFLRREAALAESGFGRTHLRMWLWVDDAGEVLASCETYAGTAWYCDDVGRTSLEPLQAIASVLVVPELRGQGHAAAMMAALSVELRALGTTVSTLFSDVGPNLYRKAGYLLHPARKTVIAVPGHMAAPTGVVELGLGDLADVLERDREELGAWVGGSTAPALAEVVQVDRVAWFATRARYRAWARGTEASPVLGVAVGDSFCLWSADAADPLLHMLAWRPRTPHDAEKMVHAALAHAAELGLRQVEFWDADRDTGLDPWRRPAVQPPGVGQSRETGLPMMAWLQQGRPMPLVWMGIERYAWC